MDEVLALRKNKKYAEALELLRRQAPSFLASQELAVISFWLKDKEVGLLHSAICELANKTINHQWAVTNTTWYAEKLPWEKVVTLTAKNIQPKFLPCNPSLSKAAGEGWWSILRTINWQQKGAKEYVVDPEFKGVCLTTNFLLRLDEELNVKSEVRIEDPEQVQKDGSRPVKGMEDMRIYIDQPAGESGSFSAGLCATFTLLNNQRHKDGFVRIGQVRLGEDGKTSVVTEIPSPTEARCEKNWLPFRFHDKPAFFYGYDPITVVDSAGAIVYQRYSPYNCSSFRGSAGPVPYEGGYLVVIHECGFFDGYRKYFHRFVKYDDCFGFVDISRPFFFDHLGVEFCSGMGIANDKLYLGCGIEDSEAKIVIVSPSVVDSMWMNFESCLKAYLKS